MEESLSKRLKENIEEKGEIARYEQFLLFSQCFHKSFLFEYRLVNTCISNLVPCSTICTTAPPGWLSGESVGLMTWWLWIRSPVEANFLSGVFPPLTSAEACEKSCWLCWGLTPL